MLAATTRTMRSVGTAARIQLMADHPAKEATPEDGGRMCEFAVQPNALTARERQKAACATAGGRYMVARSPPPVYLARSPQPPHQNGEASSAALVCVALWLSLAV